MKTAKTYSTDKAKIQSMINGLKRAIKQQRSQALNAIAQIYHPKYEFPYSRYPDDKSLAEQREEKISSLIEAMNKRIDELRAEIKAAQAHMESLPVPYAKDDKVRFWDGPKEGEDATVFSVDAKNEELVVILEHDGESIKCSFKNVRPIKVRKKK